MPYGRGTSMVGHGSPIPGARPGPAPPALPRAVLDHSPLGICTVGPEGSVLAVNPALRRMLAAAPVTVADLVEPGDLPAVEAMLARLSAGGAERLAVERRCRRADGSTFGARLTAAAVPDAGYAVLMVEDVEERWQVDAAIADVAARLETLTRAKSALVASVSHEFRTALTGIVGFSELLRDRELAHAEVRELAADINGEAQRLGRLIDDLLDLDRLESGGTPLRRRPVDTGALLVEQAERVRRNVSGHGVDVRLGPALPPVQGDRDRLTQVLTNLLSNAVKYSPAGSLIELAAEAIDGGVRLSVRDHGPGLPPDALELVFDRYRRLEREVTAGVAGTGLGLPIVRQIVQMHGGRVWAANAPAGGAVFTVELPLSGGAESGGADRLL